MTPSSLAKARPKDHRSFPSQCWRPWRTMSIRRARTWIGATLSLLLLVSSSAWSANAAAVAPDPLLGSAEVAPSTDHDDAGKPEAFQSLATASGSIRSLTAYIDGESTATAVEVGLYSEVDGHPADLLVSGRIDAPDGDAWNSVTV